MTDMYHGQRCSVGICTPWPKVTLPSGKTVLEPMPPIWFRHRSQLHMGTNFNVFELFADGLEVDDARNQTVKAMLAHDPRPEYLFFIDYDTLIPPDALTKLLFRAKCFPDYDVYAGVYCLKNGSVPDPLIYREFGEGAFWDWTVGDLLTTDQHNIRSTHMGLTLIRTKLFQRMLDAGVVHGDGTDLDDEPFYLTQDTTEHRDGAVMRRQNTEDLYFYAKARKVDCQIMVDTSVLAGHLDNKTGIVYGLPPDYGPAWRAKWMIKTGKATRDRAEADKQGMKLALDIGAGGTRREWPDHVTYTTDIRPDTEPDYVQDTRLLNLPDNHFDLVASSHHLEHLGRYDQEHVWQEMFRVLRPGGKMEHIVPNLEWAAAKIVEGECDEWVMHVLYGAQESHGYKREHNLHYFGYTPAIAKALAESCGLVDVRTQSYKEVPDLGFNLLIEGIKPAAASVSAVDTLADQHGGPLGPPPGNGAGAAASPPREGDRDNREDSVQGVGEVVESKLSKSSFVANVSRNYLEPESLQSFVDEGECDEWVNHRLEPWVDSMTASPATGPDVAAALYGGG